MAKRSLGRRRCGAPDSCASTKLTNSLSEAPVAFSTLASDSVLGQRCLPSLVMRLLLLKVVGSSPACRASPEGERLYRAARRSMARQTLWCSSMGTLSYNLGLHAEIGRASCRERVCPYV